MNIEKLLIKKAIQKNKTIVFPEASFSQRILVASQIIAKQKIANVILIGNENLIEKLNYKNNIQIINPENYKNKKELANAIYDVRKQKGLTYEQAYELLNDPIYFANAYVLCNFADGIVCGAEVSTAKTLKPALQLLKGKQGLISSYFLFVGKNRVTDQVFMMGDCAVVENPNANQLNTIAELMLQESKKFNLIQPRFAFLSYSTCGSAKSDNIDKVRDAYLQFSKNNPNVKAIGEVQFDASINKDVAKVKMPNYNFKKPANMFVMPNIEAGNICYKTTQYFGGLKALGPITLGFKKPVNDLSRGSTVSDIVLVTAITCIQCD